MASNYIYTGKVVDHKNTGAELIRSGSVVLMGKIIGVALKDIASGTIGPVQVEEVFSLPKKNGDALSFGDAVYWSDSDKAIVKTATGNTLAGKAFSDAASAATVVYVKLNA